MESEEGKVEEIELDFGFCLLYILFVVLSCGLSNMLGAYRPKKKVMDLIK
jgi:hypothetical protein